MALTLRQPLDESVGLLDERPQLLHHERMPLEGVLQVCARALVHAVVSASSFAKLSLGPSGML